MKKVLIAEKHILTEAEGRCLSSDLSEEVDLESKHYENDKDCQQANYKLPGRFQNIFFVWILKVGLSDRISIAGTLF